eukprot:1847861-Rhodomonas_salina.1
MPRTAPPSQPEAARQERGCDQGPDPACGSLSLSLSLSADQSRGGVHTLVPGKQVSVRSRDCQCEVT